ncbi:MAG: sugar-transfer associated ATP-grasp domain-containing protein, partial [Pseudomonadales bacterium]
VGIDLATGRALLAVQHGRPITKHPDTGNDLADIEIPHWERLLPLAAACYGVTGLGYLGVDIVLDHHLGPLIIELNARPGLAIQVASNAGLMPRLQNVDALAEKHTDAFQRAEWSKQTFGVIGLSFPASES